MQRVSYNLPSSGRECGSALGTRNNDSQSSRATTIANRIEGRDKNAGPATDVASASLRVRRSAAVRGSLSWLFGQGRQRALLI